MELADNASAISGAVGSSDSSSQTRSSISRLTPWLVCLSAALFFFYEFIQMMMFDAISDNLMRDFSVTAKGIAVLSSTYFLADVAFLFPAGMMLDLQDRLGLSYLFVAHDLSVVKHISDRVAVMYVGKIVEVAKTKDLFQSPRHPYTEALLSAVPVPDPRARSKRIVLEGDVADPANPPSGCYFHPRCPYATERCRNETPVLSESAPDHQVACHRADELSLNGIAAAA